MNLTAQIAKQLRDLHFGGNWTWSTFKDHLSDLTWQQATTKVYSCNTIATLVYHMNYYLNAVADRVIGNPPVAKHELSFQHPPITSQRDWDQLLDKTWSDVERFAHQIEQMPEEKLWRSISEEHGNYYTNIHGVIEHNHYHLGQIVILKKILAAQS